MPLDDFFTGICSTSAYLYKCFCLLFSLSSSLILCCSWSKNVLSNMRHGERSCGIVLLLTYWTCSKFIVTTTSNSFNFSCFSLWRDKKAITIWLPYKRCRLSFVQYNCVTLKNSLKNIFCMYYSANFQQI